MIHFVVFPSDLFVPQITGNNRIKVWKLNAVSHSKNEVGRLLCEVYEPNHLKMNYTALAIFDDNEKGDNLINQCLVAVGDKQGRIVVFDASKSSKMLEISNQTNDLSKDFVHVKGGHESRINCIRFDRVLNDNSKDKSLHIITCSNRKKLCRWNLTGTMLSSQSLGEHVPYSLITTFPTKKTQRRFMMVGSRNIAIWNMDIVESVNSRAIATLQGHATQVGNRWFIPFLFCWIIPFSLYVHCSFRSAT